MAGKRSTRVKAFVSGNGTEQLSDIESTPDVCSHCIRDMMDKFVPSGGAVTGIEGLSG